MLHRAIRSLATIIEMDWKTFVASVVGKLTWPIVVVIALVLFRNPIGGFIDRATEARFGKWFSVSAKDRDAAEKAKKETIEAVKEREIVMKKDTASDDQGEAWIEMIKNTSATNLDWSAIESQIDSNPRGAVIAAHAEVLHGLIDTQLDVNHTSRSLALADLESRGWIPKAFMDSLEEVLELGDPVERNGKAVIAEDDARNYVAAAKSVAETLETLVPGWAGKQWRGPVA
jgi:hypothetical protein